jgi:hypothetical protein
MLSGVRAQTLEWARSFGSAGSDIVFSIALDASGNTYATGYFSDTVDFDPGVGVLELASNGLADIFVLKLDAGGHLEWAKSVGAAENDFGYFLALDPSNSVYVTGQMRDTVDFDPGPGVSTVGTHGARDAFVLKLDEDGDFLWAKGMGGPGGDAGYSLAADASGVYTTGFFGGVADFDPGANVFNLTSNGSEDIFIQKLNASGTFIAAVGIGDSLLDNGVGIAVDGAGGVAVTGNFQASPDFDPGPGSFVMTSSGGDDIFLLKLDPFMSFVWAKSYGDSLADIGSTVDIDSSGNIYSGGLFHGAVDFGGGAHVAPGTAYDGYVQKVDPSGNWIWSKNMGGDGTDVVNALSLYGENDVYLTGWFNDTADLDPGGGTAEFISNGLADIFLEKLNSDGDLDWVWTFGSDTTDFGFSAAAGGGIVSLAGSFRGTLDADPGSGVSNLSCAGSDDGFIEKLSLPVGLYDIGSADHWLSVYPSPATGWITFRTNLATAQAQIVNVHGQVMYEVDVVNDGTLNVSSLPSGVYLVRHEDMPESAVRFVKL